MECREIHVYGVSCHLVLDQRYPADLADSEQLPQVAPDSAVVSRDRAQQGIEFRYNNSYRSYLGRPSLIIGDD